MSQTSAKNTAAPGVAQRFHDRLAALVGRPLFWALLVSFLLAGPLLRVMLMDAPGKLPIYGTVDNFRLLNHRGEPYGSPELKGRVWVAGVVCTACPYYNPDYARQMSEIQHRSRNLGTAFQLVSLSINPSVDTPEALAKFAADLRASKRMGNFVTGPVEQVKSTVVNIMSRSAIANRPGPPPKNTSKLDPNRTQYLALIDGRMQIRGYYDCRKKTSIDELMSHIGLLANSKKKPQTH